MSNKSSKASMPQHSFRGFSLLELMVAMLMFMVIGAATMSLIKAHMPMASSSANQSGLTMNLRNGLSQIELDAVNAGTASYPGVNIPYWPVGFTIVNASQATPCNNPVTFTFGPNCFDTLTIVAGDTTVPPLQPLNTTTVNTDTTTAATLQVPATTTAAAVAASLHTGDELLWLHPGNGGGTYVTTTTLTAPATVNGTNVNISFTSTTNNGVNGADAYSIASHQDLTYKNLTVLGSTYNSPQLNPPADWVIKLSPITYSVDLTTPSNPKLIRTQGANVDVVAEQVIGFRVGASLRFVGSGTDSNYSFDSSSTGYNYDWAQVRAIRVSMIGRTTPSSDISTNFRNQFDQGAYKIQGLSVTINPRNLSMTDQ